MLKEPVLIRKVVATAILLILFLVSPALSTVLESPNLHKSNTQSAQADKNHPLFPANNINAVEAAKLHNTDSVQEQYLWENGSPAIFAGDVPGPGALLGTPFRWFAAASAEADARIKKLADGIPQVFPDLKIVLTAL